ncbi:hypothetical protein AUP68_06530 [Ilyonectria robusta]
MELLNTVQQFFAWIAKTIRNLVYAHLYLRGHQNIRRDPTSHPPPTPPPQPTCAPNMPRQVRRNAVPPPRPVVQQAVRSYSATLRRPSDSPPDLPLPSRPAQTSISQHMSPSGCPGSPTYLNSIPAHKHVPQPDSSKIDDVVPGIGWV